jgi:hypothetical protein
MKIELDFTQTEVDRLAHTHMFSFVNEQEGRFWPEAEVEKVIKIEQEQGIGCLHWCYTLVDAKIFQTYWQQKGLTAILLGDEAEDFDYCVFLDVTMEKYGEVNDES